MSSPEKIDLEKWCEDLRSGKFQQCRNVLYDYSTQGYCCLGVLFKTQFGYTESSDGKSSCFTQFDASGEYDWQKRLNERGLPFDTIDKLVRLNDSGQSFETIASYIQSEVRLDGENHQN